MGASSARLEERPGALSGGSTGDGRAGARRGSQERIARFGVEQTHQVVLDGEVDPSAGAVARSRGRTCAKRALELERPLADLQQIEPVGLANRAPHAQVLALTSHPDAQPDQPYGLLHSATRLALCWCQTEPARVNNHVASGTVLELRGSPRPSLARLRSLAWNGADEQDGYRTEVRVPLGQTCTAPGEVRRPDNDVLLLLAAPNLD